MKEIFTKNQTVIFRTLGILMFLIAFSVYFWITPKQGVSENEIAARNVARMEARIGGASSASTKAQKPKHTPIMKSYKETQAKQMRYMLILSMIVGVGFLGYSFVKKRS